MKIHQIQNIIGGLLFAALFLLFFIAGCARSDQANINVSSDLTSINSDSLELIAQPVGPLTPSIGDIDLLPGDQSTTIDLLIAVVNPAGELSFTASNRSIDPPAIISGTLNEDKNSFSIDEMPLVSGQNIIELELFQDGQLVHSATLMLYTEEGQVQSNLQVLSN